MFWTKKEVDFNAALQPRAAPFNEEKQRQMLAMVMDAKEAHAAGAHDAEPNDFCPECKRVKRAELQTSADRAAFKMRESQRLAYWILREPKQWALLQAMLRALND